MSVSDELREALVTAYQPYVRERLAERGIDPPPGLDGALAQGQEWLDEQLASLLSLPFPRQPRGPLEVFQEAMRFPTRVLDEAGVPPVERDAVAEHALPGDRYDLAPASSSLLGEEVWRAHLAWGAAKAQALRDQA